MADILKNIVLIGFMGTGKSSLGRKLAASLGYRFQDMDQLIVQAAGMEISDIFKKEGETSFRERESAALESLLRQENCVIATGGGVVSRPQNIPLLRRLGFVVWLQASEEVIFERVSRNKKRPLLHTPNPRQTIHELMVAREPLYSQTAHFSLDTSGQAPESLARTLLSETEHFFSCPPI